jgi:hypothetical protein
MATEALRKKRGKRAELDHWLERARPVRIDEAAWNELRDALAPISDSYLRKLLRESGVALSPVVEGVRQSGFEELESSLLGLLDEYETGDPHRRSVIRNLVIAAKEHARWAAKYPDKREQKEEMVLWMRTWLENPPVFRDWVGLRKAAMGLSFSPE